MSFISRKYSQNKKISSLTDKISKELGVDKSIILHFICIDLERIYFNKLNIHNIKLKNFENEFAVLGNKESELKRSVENKINQIASLQNSIQNLSVLLGEKEKILVEKKIQLGNFQNKINDLNSNLNSLEKEKKQIEYKIMMKSHSIKIINQKK